MIIKDEGINPTTGRNKMETARAKDVTPNLGILEDAHGEFKHYTIWGKDEKSGIDFNDGYACVYKVYLDLSDAVGASFLIEGTDAQIKAHKEAVLRAVKATK